MDKEQSHYGPVPIAETVFIADEINDLFKYRLTAALTRVLYDLAKELNEKGVRWGLIGRLALARFTEPQATQDVDILVAAKPTPRLKGFDQVSIDAYMHASTGKNVDVVGPQPDSDLPVGLVEEALESVMVEPLADVPCRIVPPQWLAALKLYSGLRRRHPSKILTDQADALRLVEVLGTRWVGEFRPVVVRYLGPEEKKLLEELETKLSEYRPLK